MNVSAAILYVTRPTEGQKGPIQMNLLWNKLERDKKGCQIEGDEKRKKDPQKIEGTRRFV